jgi:hypothetical protein
MTFRSTSLLIALLSFAPLALAVDAAPLAEPVQVAQATPAMPTGTDAATPAPRAVHGTLRGVLAAADKGPDALRQYVQRTRMIYGYRFEDFAHADWYR